MSYAKISTKKLLQNSEKQTPYSLVISRIQNKLRNLHVSNANKQLDKVKCVKIANAFCVQSAQPRLIVRNVNKSARQ